ncbi:hypothetical protein MA16_Dca022685 [Dendrobium catenatum]|uniref:Uncharacterized protein n=1 Tax=Dendrobium catenatum TaxID=906689 RepID=A0A2I0W239_9ASPA|nr:hypothetical protein MA16_Dca022685 [Dendrobium catenatum]
MILEADAHTPKDLNVCNVISDGQGVVSVVGMEDSLAPVSFQDNLEVDNMGVCNVNTVVSNASTCDLVISSEEPSLSIHVPSLDLEVGANGRSFGEELDVHEEEYNAIFYLKVNHIVEKAFSSGVASSVGINLIEKKTGLGLGTLQEVLNRKSIIVAPLKVASYLPNSDSSPGKKLVSSISPSSEVKSAESIEEYTVLRKLEPSGRINLDPFRGKSGCVSFCGLSHQLVEARNLVSSPFEDGKGSILWIAAPLALISSLLLPQFFINNSIEVFVKNEVLKVLLSDCNLTVAISTDIVTFFSAEIIFYIGLGIFLSITDHVQRPYIDFSPKQWSLITGLKGYLSSAFFAMGVKVVAPIAAVYVVWPVIALPAAVAVAPFLLGCAVQFAFELHLDKRQSSCWPVLPIIFEVYRLYQLSRGSYFLEKLMFSMKGAQMTPKVIERGNALFSLVVLFQILAVVSLWSLATFLLRLFPSRPVAENY